MSDQYIYIYGTKCLEVGLDELEDELQEAIEPFAEVTGTGSGESGWNIDIDLESIEPMNHVLGKSMQVLCRYVKSIDYDTVSINVSGTKVSMDQLRDSLK